MNTLRRQIIRASLPARRAILRRRLGRVTLEEVDGLTLVILAQVFNPVVFRTGVLLARAAARAVESLAPPQRPNDPTTRRPTVLDMGSGSGIGALFAARAGASVTAVDVNPDAVRCARINALMNCFEDRIHVTEGDLFAPVVGQTFDLVIFNPPFFRGAPRSVLDKAWRSENVLERFADGLPEVLSPGGIGLIGFSSDGDEAGLLTAITRAGLRHSVSARHDLGNEIVTIYSVCREEPSPGDAT